MPLDPVNDKWTEPSAANAESSIAQIYTSFAVANQAIVKYILETVDHEIATIDAVVYECFQLPEALAYWNPEAAIVGPEHKHRRSMIYMAVKYGLRLYIDKVSVAENKGDNNG